MKIAAIAMCCLVLPNAATPSVKVEKPVPHECSQRLRLVVTFDGRPMNGAIVTFYDGFYSDQKPALFAVSTKEDGVASIPKLKPGEYHADISFDGIRSVIFEQPVTTSIFLHVMPKLDISTIATDLGKPARDIWNGNQEFERHLDAIISLPIHDRLSNFQQSIVDPLGAGITSAETWVVEKQLQGWVVRFKGMPDAKGRVTAELRPGKYVVISSCFGFRSAVVPFEIAHDGSGELKTVLQLAPATE